MIDWGLALGVVGAAAGAWVGAWAAFRLERADKLSREHLHRGEALRRAMFILLARRTVLVNITKQHLSKFTTSPLRHVELQPFFVVGEDLPLDLESLLFIFDEAEADLLNRLQVHSRRYRTVLWAIEFRNRIHLEGQEAVAAVGGTDQVSVEELRRLVGPHRWAQLKDLTDSIYEDAASTIIDIESDFRAVEAVAVAMFPEVKLFKVRQLAAQSMGGAV